MLSIRVSACSGGNLTAIAQRGERERVPASSLQGERVYLQDGSIDFDGEGMPERQQFLVVRDRAFDIGTDTRFRRHTETPGAK